MPDHIIYKYLDQGRTKKEINHEWKESERLMLWLILEYFGNGWNFFLKTVDVWRHYLALCKSGLAQKKYNRSTFENNNQT